MNVVTEVQKTGLALHISLSWFGQMPLALLLSGRPLSRDDSCCQRQDLVSSPSLELLSFLPIIIIMDNNKAHAHFQAKRRHNENRGALSQIPTYIHT
jgi:hypothetical protein